MGTPLPSLRVVKVGGSLLDWNELPSRLADVLAGHPTGRSILVVGGGRFVDVVRGLDRAHGLGEDRAHALAVRALDVTAQLLAAIVPGLAVVESLDEARAVGGGRVPVLAPRRFLEEDDRGPDPLPHAWAVTSDSIAARVATRLCAEELILLKSASLPEGAGRLEAARLGLVDEAFPVVAAGLRRVLYANLRDRLDRPRPLR